MGFGKEVPDQWLRFFFELDLELVEGTDLLCECACEAVLCAAECVVADECGVLLCVVSRPRRERMERVPGARRTGSAT